MLKISGWEKWQTYRKDRGTPPWVKVYRNLLSNAEWAELTDAEKGQLVSIWLVAADKQGLIPKSPRVIRKICLLDEEPNINKFIELGFMATACQPSDNQMVTINDKSDAPETETETETETEQPDEDSEFFDMKSLNALAVKYLGWQPIMTAGRAESLRQLTQVFKPDVERGFKAASDAGAKSINYVIKVAQDSPATNSDVDDFERLCLGDTK